MKPSAFEYETPERTDEALELLARDPEETKVLAGGQSLVPLLNFRLARPDRLVDLNGVGELAYLRRDDGALRIGAMTRQATLERSSIVEERWPLLKQAIRLVAHPQIRNRGTVGGSAAHADPAAELPVALTALDATFHIRSARGSRAVPARDFFLQPLMSAIEPGELLVEIETPPMAANSGTAFVEYARRHGDFALGGAAVVLDHEDDGSIGRAAIALLGAGPTPLRASAAEAALVGATVDEASAAEVAALAVEDVRPTGDIHGSAEYRQGLLRSLVRQALLQAAQVPRAA
ncbi:MAG: aerobic carbon-monoxide dehydrogenase medium subunit [Thermoleophilaceae bacterium]|nr:aerobic carbon-monoxide dehydrogenase medium subunit [Thermoleophilaceae bacterium]